MRPARPPLLSHFLVKEHGWLKNPLAKLPLGSGKKQPDAKWIAEASQAHPNTPDLVWITRKPFHLLFVYGTQMRGHPQHELVMEHGAYMATAYTDGKFCVWKKRLGKESYPIALDNSTHLQEGHLAAGWKRPDWAMPPRNRVQGELYAIEVNQLIALDRHFQNTLEFRRLRVPMLLPYRNLYKIPETPLQKHIDASLGIPPKDQVVTQSVEIQTLKAWMYIGKSEYWSGKEDHMFSPVNVYRPRLAWLGDYYAFTKEDYSK
jgi:gamma-glutamylcyclotransferase (GGCT)/AIG2-like uncharacterized protein YtfP